MLAFRRESRLYRLCKPRARKKQGGRGWEGDSDGETEAERLLWGGVRMKHEGVRMMRDAVQVPWSWRALFD